VKDFTKISYNPSVLFANGKWNADALAALGASVKSALAADTIALITGSPFFSPEVTGDLPAYVQGVCNPPYQLATLRFVIVGDDRIPEAEFHEGNGAITDAPDHDIPYARLATFFCKRGGKIEVGAPGAMWRSPDGYYCGIPGHQQPKHGRLTEFNGTKLGVSLDGSFTYTHDGSPGEVDEVPFFLLKIPAFDGDPDGFQPPRELTSQIRYDAETHDFCAVGKVPHRDPSFSFELGWRLGRLFGTSVVYEPPINEAQFPVYEPAQVGDPMDGENCAPDVVRLANEVIIPFMRGVLYAVPDATFSGGEAAGPLDLRAVVTIMRQLAPVEIATAHWYSWFTGPDLFGDTVRSLGGIKQFLITETDQYDKLLKLAQTTLPYITHILGASGQDGIAKAVR
jgi:hypothetical protein